MATDSQGNNFVFSGSTYTVTSVTERRAETCWITRTLALRVQLIAHINRRPSRMTRSAAKRLGWGFLRSARPGRSHLRPRRTRQPSQAQVLPIALASSSSSR